MRIIDLTEDHLDEAGRLVASLPLYQSYGLTADRAGKALASNLGKDRVVMLAAVEDGQLLGVAWFVRRGCFDRSGYLKQIAVSSAAQGKGVGARLLTELEDRHLSEGGVVLMVTRSNQPARGFYEKLGYSHVGEIPAYVQKQHDECIYYKAPAG